MSIRYFTEALWSNAHRLAFLLAVEMMRVNFAAAVPVASADSDCSVKEPLDDVLAADSSLRRHLAECFS